MARQHENVSVQGVGAGRFAWALFEYLRDCEIPATLIVAHEKFLPSEYEPYIRQSERLCIVVSLDGADLHGIDRKLVRRSLRATSPTTALVGNTGTILDLNGSDMEAFFQKGARAPSRKSFVSDTNLDVDTDLGEFFPRKEVSYE